MRPQTIRIDQQAARGFAEAMMLERGAGAKAVAQVLPEPPRWQPIAIPNPLRPGDIDMGQADVGGLVGLSLDGLMDGRLLIQGVSGAGKSWTLRRLLEQTAGLVQQIVIDPEGEFGTLGEALRMVRIDGETLGIAAAAAAARRAREHRLSVLLDLSQADRERQMQVVAVFVGALVSAPRDHWHPAIVAVDEAHLFAPYGGQAAGSVSVRKAAIGALTDLMSRGRKRGLSGILATQRLARLAKSVASEAQNFMVGLNTLDLDIRRAAETIGWDARRAFDRLPMLEPGHFVAVGPAFSLSPSVITVGAVDSVHGGARPEIVAPPRLQAEEAARVLDLEALSSESSAESDLQPGLRAVRGFIRDPSFGLAARIYQGLVPLFPEGAAVTDLGPHFTAGPEAVAGALALLDQFGILEFTGEAGARAVRIAKGQLAAGRSAA